MELQLNNKGVKKSLAFSAVIVVDIIIIVVIIITITTTITL